MLRSFKIYRIRNGWQTYKTVCTVLKQHTIDMSFLYHPTQNNTLVEHTTMISIPNLVHWPPGPSQQRTAKSCRSWVVLIIWGEQRGVYIIQGDALTGERIDCSWKGGQIAEESRGVLNIVSCGCLFLPACSLFGHIQSLNVPGIWFTIVSEVSLIRAQNRWRGPAM